MTKRLYYDNSYLAEFDAQVVEQFRKGNTFAVILDQTAFYPNSGGQMHDLGWLNNQPVLEVVEEGDEVAHLVAEPLVVKTVFGKIDWARRFDFMQQHTGFHILAQSFLQLLHVETIASHLGEKRDTIDVGLPDLSWEQVHRVEELANQIVFENRQVESFWISRQDAENLALRKPPKFIDKPIRLIDVKDFDLDPCGGTHVRSTGEVGLIKVLFWEKVRGNIRCTFVTGRRALQDFQKRVVIMQQLNQALSATDDEIVVQAEGLKLGIKEKEKQIKKLQEVLLEHETDQLVRQWQQQPQKLWLHEFQDKSAQELRYLAIKASKMLPVIAVFYCSTAPAFMVIARSETLAVDLQPLIPKLLSVAGAKGGGKSGFVELNQLDPLRLPQVFELLHDFLK